MKTKQQIAQDLRNALNEKDISKREEMITQAENDLYELVKSKEPIEKNEFIQGLYSTAGSLVKGIGTAAKLNPYFTGPLIYTATPLTEAARMGVRALNPEAQYETPEPDMLAEIKSGIDVSDRAGFGPLFKDIVTASGGENVGIPSPEYMKEQFPQLSSALEEITKPANIASLGLDYILGSKASSKFAPKENIIKPRMVSENTALGYLKSISKDDKLMLDLLKEKENYKLLSPEKKAIAPAPRIDKIVNIIKENPDKYLKIMKPNELFLTLQDDLAKLKAQQDMVVENMPKTAVTDAEDLQRLALSKLRGEEAGQMESAKAIIKRNIPFKDIEDRVFNSIDRISQLRREIKKKGKVLDSEKLGLINEIELQKNKIIKDIENSPEVKLDPTIINGVRNLEIEIGGTREDLISSSLDRISELNNEINEISNKKSKSVDNSNYLSKINELDNLKKSLRDANVSMRDEFGRVYAEGEDYISDINAINEVTPQYISKKRQLGNKLKSDYATMPSIEQKPLSLAGSAIESASSEIQDAIMQSANKSDFDLYKDTNYEMSTRIPFRNLVEKNLLDDGGFLHIPAATATGRTGILESAQTMGPRYIRPTMSKLKYGAGNVMKTPLEASKYSGEMMMVPSYREKAEQARNPQSLGVALASYEIPRNTQKIMQESDLVLAKIAQNTTTPEGQVLFDAVHDAIKNAPNKVPKLMQILSQQMPGIFQYSEYNSFDNIVPEQNRKMALKKINNSKNLDNSQKAQKIKALINEGYLDEF